MVLVVLFFPLRSGGVLCLLCPLRPVCLPVRLPSLPPSLLAACRAFCCARLAVRRLACLWFSCFRRCRAFAALPRVRPAAWVCPFGFRVARALGLCPSPCPARVAGRCFRLGLAVFGRLPVSAAACAVCPLPSPLAPFSRRVSFCPPCPVFWFSPPVAGFGCACRFRFAGVCGCGWRRPCRRLCGWCVWRFAFVGPGFRPCPGLVFAVLFRPLRFGRPRGFACSGGGCRPRLPRPPARPRVWLCFWRLPCRHCPGVVLAFWRCA